MFVKHHKLVIQRKQRFSESINPLILWSWIRTWAITNFLLRTFSLTKKIFNFICFILLWMYWLWASVIVLRLSRIIFGIWNLQWSSLRRNWTQSIYAIRLANLLYLTSALDLVTNDCFFDHQEMRLGLRNTQALEIDLLSSRYDAQLASQNPRSDKGWWISLNK